MEKDQQYLARHTHGKGTGAHHQQAQVSGIVAQRLGHALSNPRKGNLLAGRNGPFDALRLHRLHLNYVFCNALVARCGCAVAHICGRHLVGLWHHWLGGHLRRPAHRDDCRHIVIRLFDSV